MTFKEFKKWANERTCDGQWSIGHIWLTQDIYKIMHKTNIFNRRKVWQKECEDVAIAIIEDVRRKQERLKNE